MVIKDFSPLKSNTTNYYLNSSDFAGTELFFTDSNANLYIMLLRDNFIHQDVVYYTLIDGVYNGIDYDYRIDFANDIQILHTDAKNNTFFDVIPQYIYDDPSIINDFNKMRPFYTEMRDAISSMYICINSTDFFNTFYNNGYISRLANNDYIVDYNNLNIVLVSLDHHFNFNFIDYSKYGQFSADGYSVPDKIYANSYLPILIDQNVPISYITCYMSNSYVIYAPTSSYSGDKIRTYYFYIPKDTKRIRFQLNGDEFYKDTTNICSKNQYFYFGLENPIESISFTGKKDKIDVNNKNLIDFGKEKKVVSMTINHKIIQNTGHNITENDIFSVAKSPYIFTINTNSEVINGFIQTGGTINFEEYIIDDVNFTGYNTKPYSERNIVLNLTKKNINNRFTSFNTGFYS